MIVRMWHGRVLSGKAQHYREFLKERAIADYRSVAGNISVYVLERREGEVTLLAVLLARRRTVQAPRRRGCS